MAKDILQNFSNVFVFRVINIVFILFRRKCKMATMINGCDTMIQINTAAKLLTLQNNGYCSVGFLG